jgi:RNA polymerase sigma-70 factor (ECF subfamily)
MDQPEQLGTSARTAEFLSLFSENQTWILGSIYHLVHNYHDAQDVFQRTSLILWQKFDNFESGTNFRAWACQIAFYQAKGFLRDAGRDRLCFNEALLETLLNERESSKDPLDRRHDFLAACIAKLSPNDQKMIQEVYGKEATVLEIAERLGYAAQTLYNRLNKARRRLHLCVNIQLQEAQ